MSYESKSIREVISMIGRNEIYLPAIQRKFVWKPEQIESLFDSIMRGYPIGTFLFWFIRGEKINDYTFYKFIQDYHERDKYLNDIAPRPELKEEIVGVLDGQQRLSSMYIALQGTYAYKKAYARWYNDSAFPKRRFYINLLSEPEDDAGYMYEFKFLTEEEARNLDEKHLWFLVRDVMLWGEEPEIDEYYDNLLNSDYVSDGLKVCIEEKRRQVKKTLRILHQRIVIEKLINYYKIEEQELDNILDIFVRVNSGGTVLSKSDLLFSTIVANWQEARQKIEDLLSTINKKGNGFYFDNDFIMRSCLVLTDCPILFKVRSFKKENINKIKSQWENIEISITKAVDLLVEFGFNGETLTSQNAIIPIAYYFIKGGESDKSKDDIRRYLIYALLKQIYGSQGDRVLAAIRDVLKDAFKEHKYFSFDYIVNNAKLPSGKSLKITDEDIEEILEYKKGPYTFMILSLLYPNLKFGQIEFHQDHIHPASMFTESKLGKLGVSKDNIKKWKDMKDRLPNLQLMEGRENKSKNKTPFKEWLKNAYPNPDERGKFMKDNYIPDHVSLELKDFEVFYEERKKILKAQLKKVLQQK